MDEKSRLENVANWYGTQGFYGRLVYYGFQSLKPFLVGSKCLELGPADGAMTRYLLETFQQITSVEGSSTYCEHLRNELGHYPGFSVENSLFEEYNADSVFDTVIATHVLEHLGDPVNVVRRVKEWVSQDSVFITLVPNALSFHRLVAVKMGLLKTPDQLNELDLRLGHRRVYNPDLLRNHLESAGWEVQATGGILFKTLTNGQIEEWFTEQMMDGFYELGKDFPEYAAEIYAVCRLPRS